MFFRKEYVTLELPQGRIRGYKAQALYGDCYYGFEGIPYAEPPLGSLRFLSPVPVKKWSGLKDCLDFANKPLQKNEWGLIEGSEDCLYLNVFTKNVRNLRKLEARGFPFYILIKKKCPDTACKKVTRNNMDTWWRICCRRLPQRIYLWTGLFYDGRSDFSYFQLSFISVR